MSRPLEPSLTPRLLIRRRPAAAAGLTKLLRRWEFWVLLSASLLLLRLFNESYIDTLLYGESGVIGGIDTAFYYFWLRSAVFDFDLDFRNEILFYNAWSPELREYFLQAKPTPTALLPNKYSIGWALLSAPGMLLGHLAALLCRALGVSVALNGYSTPYQFGIALVQFLYALGSLALSARLLEQVLGMERVRAAALSVLVMLSSFMLFYQTAELYMAHNVTYFCCLLLYLRTAQFDRQAVNRGAECSYRQGAIIAILAGLLLLCRMQAGVYLLYPALVLLRRRNLRLILLSGCCFALSLLPQALAWQKLYGRPLYYSYEGEGFHWLNPAWSSSLFSSFHGLFYWHPLYLLGLLCFLGCYLPKRTLLVCSLAVSLVANWYVNAAWHNWWFGVSFGSRAYECATIAVLLGLGAAVSRARLSVPLFALLAVMAVWNIYLDLCALTGVLPLDRGVSYPEMWQCRPRLLRYMRGQPLD